MLIWKNFKLLQNDPETGRIFSQPPLIFFKRDKNIDNFLVLRVLKSDDQLAGTFKYNTTLFLSFTNDLLNHSGQSTFSTQLKPKPNVCVPHLYRIKLSISQNSTRPVTRHACHTNRLSFLCFQRTKYSTVPGVFQQPCPVFFPLR